MTVGVGASGFVGIAPESTPGTYVAPTVFMLLRGETLKYDQATIWRRPLRGIADISGALPGNSQVNGDLTVEVTHDTLPYLLKAARGTITKTLSGPYKYAFVPNAAAVPSTTLSITVVRNGQVFGFTGCVIGNQKYSIDGGLLVGVLGIVGQNEASQSLPTPTYVTTNPFGVGQYNLQIPTATQIFDADTFELNIADAADPQFRLKNTGTGAQFVKYGERKVECTVDRDFESRSGYDAFKALTATSVTLKCIQTAAAAEIDFIVPAAISETYEITGLTGQADLIRAKVKYAGVYDVGTSKSYEIDVWSNINMT